MTQVTQRAVVLWDAGDPWNDILAMLRAEGFSKIECIRATVELLRLPLADAKRIVHYSQTWSDTRQQDDEWHDMLVIELEAGGVRQR